MNTHKIRTGRRNHRSRWLSRKAWAWRLRYASVEVPKRRVRMVASRLWVNFDRRAREDLPGIRQMAAM